MLTEDTTKVIVLFVLVVFVLVATHILEATVHLCSAMSVVANKSRLKRMREIALFIRRVHYVNVGSFLFLQSTWSPITKVFKLVFTSAPSEAVLFLLCLVVCVLLQTISGDISGAIKSFVRRVGTLGRSINTQSINATQSV